jgi:hypothetical protein
MIRVLELAKLSGAVYSASNANHFGINIVDLTSQSQLDSIENNWLKVVQINEETKTHACNHFYAALYIKFNDGDAIDAVMAIRGTLMHDPNNLWVDFKSWYSSAIGDDQHDSEPEYLPKAHTFLRASKAYLHKHFPKLHASFYLTGHSLGGSLAKLLTLTVFPYKTVVFNAPGVGEVAAVDKDDADYIVNVNALHGILNKVGETLGRNFYVNVLDEDADAILLEKHFNKAAKVYSKDAYQLSDKSQMLPSVRRLLDFIGFEYCVRAYLGSIVIARKSYAYEHEANWHPKLSDGLIDMPFSFLDYELDKPMVAVNAIISAQHSIANMVSTLAMPEYDYLADKPC